MPRQRKKGMKGNGSVFQRKDGRWVAQFIVEETGKTKQLYGTSEKEANEKLKQALQEQKQGILATGPKQKLNDYLGRWLEEVHKPQIRQSTYIRNRATIYKNIIPALGHIELRKLTPQHIQKFYSDKRKDGMSEGSIRNIHAILHKALKNAVRWNLLPVNPCEKVTPPQMEKRDTKIFTKEQLIQLIQVASQYEMGTLIKLAVTTGMRHGEMLALQWDDIDFVTNCLHIHRNVYFVGGHGHLEGPPKTERSIRQIILPQFVIDALITHRAHQDEAKNKAGTRWTQRNLVFCNPYGDFISSTSSLATFHKILKEAELPQIRMHDLRHSVATFLINVLKYPPTFVQTLLGHSNIDITLGLYTHNDPAMLGPMMDDLNNLFREHKE